MKTLVIDGNLLLYRVYFTPNSWQLSHDDHKTGGMYVFLKSLHKAMDVVYGIDRVVVVWDGSRSQRRMKLYPAYKQTRPSDNKITPELKQDFETQKVMLESVFKSIGVRSVVLPSKEGDDVIYRLVTKFNDGHSVICSDDKDMYTMLSDDVSVYRIGKDTYYTPETFRVEYGFQPQLFKYWKAIVGDSSDNIKGVVSAGEKTAEKFCKIVEVIQNAQQVLVEVSDSKDKRLRAISEQWDTVQRNIDLMDCSQEVFTSDEDSFIMRRINSPVQVDEARFIELCDQHGFTSLKSNLLWLAPFKKLK